MTGNWVCMVVAHEIARAHTHTHTHAHTCVLMYMFLCLYVQRSSQR